MGLKKDTPQTTLKIFSGGLLLLALLDLIQIVGSWLNGEFNYVLLAKVYEQKTSVVFTIIMVSLAFTVVILLTKLYLGITGSNLAKGVSTGNGHIVVGKICFVVCIIYFVILTAFTVINARTMAWHDWLDVACSFSACVILFEYLKSAKAIKENNCV